MRWEGGKRKVKLLHGLQKREIPIQMAILVVYELVPSGKFLIKNETQNGIVAIIIHVYSIATANSMCLVKL